MAKVSYPVINSVRWWILRKNFKRTIPLVVTNSYLSSVLNVTSGSANNIISPLKKIGLIDNDGKPTDRARRWRDDEEYPSVCKEIREETYPSELLDAFPDADASRSNVERWFSGKTGLGESQVSAMAMFYLLLAEADPTKQESSSTTIRATQPNKVASSAVKSGSKTKKIEKVASNGTESVATILPEANLSHPKGNANGFGPSLHIDIQIHIASDASTDQIEQIFASMAKHLYKGNNITRLCTLFHQ